jgi:hypothetical protein
MTMVGEWLPGICSIQDIRNHLTWLTALFKAGLDGIDPSPVKI